ncbi:DUF2141 domain-containing protein [uncultured Croceitalea sp.]|uniref:DUF2141 domain-containing protein n=1 Tax=uncultured Croceitalea sp. TaxID=1798908 RepID=UPI00374F6797
MKNLGFALGIFLIAFTTQAQEEEKVTVTVTVENVLNDNGNVLISLHNNETFMKGPGVIDLQEKAVKGAVTVTFKDITPGTYAVMVLHDENDNKRMDFEANGMPKESYGVSGNVMAMGPPSFTDSKFEVANKDLNLAIRF